MPAQFIAVPFAPMLATWAATREARAHQHPLCTQHQRRSHAASVGDPARGDDQHVGARIDYLREQRESGSDIPCPPASVPWATMTSAPASIASRACDRVCTWQMSRAPASRMAGAKGRGSPNESMIAAGR